MKDKNKDKNYDQSFFEALGFVVVCKQERESGSRVYEVLKYENFQFVKVFGGTIDDSIMFIYGENSKEANDTKKNMLKHFNEMLNLS